MDYDTVVADYEHNNRETTLRQWIPDRLFTYITNLNGNDLDDIIPIDVENISDFNQIIVVGKPKIDTQLYVKKIKFDVQIFPTINKYYDIIIETGNELTLFDVDEAISNFYNSKIKSDDLTLINKARKNMNILIDLPINTTYYEAIIETQDRYSLSFDIYDDDVIILDIYFDF